MKALRLHAVVLAWCAALALAAFAVTAAAAADTYADPGKVLRVALPVAETGFDPQAASDLYSSHVMRGIFDTLYEYEYLARPYRLTPALAVAMPEVTDNGRTWTIRIRQGVYFSDDPAFKGKRREVTAADVVYSFKRLLDPRMRSPY